MATSLGPKLTSFEVLPEVGGGHALLGAQPDEGHQGVSQPHHPDVGHIPTNDVEEQFARMNTYEKSAVVELSYVKSAMERSNAKSTLAFVKSAVVGNDKTYRNLELP